MIIIWASVSWATHPRALVQLIPTSAEMRRNAALGLVVCGLGLISLANRPRPPALAEALCALLAFLTLVEYALGLNPGIGGPGE